jgi:hypothetical protein
MTQAPVLTPTEPDDVVRQLVFARDVRVVDEYGNHLNPRSERLDKFPTDPVLRVVDASPSVSVRHCQPVRSDDREDDRSLTYPAQQVGHEVGSGWNGLSIQEHPVRTEDVGEACV